MNATKFTIFIKVAQTSPMLSGFPQIFPYLSRKTETSVQFSRPPQIRS